MHEFKDFEQELNNNPEPDNSCWGCLKLGLIVIAIVIATVFVILSLLLNELIRTPFLGFYLGRGFSVCIVLVVLLALIIIYKCIRRR